MKRMPTQHESAKPWSSPQLCWGRITDASTQAPAAASTIEYTATVVLPNGHVQENVVFKPAGNRPPDTEDTIPARIGSFFFGVLDIDGFHFDVREYRLAEDCPGGSGNGESVQEPLADMVLALQRRVETLESKRSIWQRLFGG